MKRFCFPLKSVATVRALREQQAREAFAATVRAVNDAEAALARARARVVEIEEVLRTGRAQAFRAGEHAEFIAAYRQELVLEQKAIDAVVQARARMETARTGWLETRRNLQAIDNLQARARRRHQVESERAEQVALDEHAALRALRLAPPPLS